MKNLAPSALAVLTASFCIIAAMSEATANESASSKTVQLPKVTVVSAKSSDGDVNGYRAGTTRSSTRTETPLLDVPQSISVVTQEQIRDQNISSIGEAVQYVPGVNIQQGENNRDQVTIRGNGSSADFFIDGARDDVQYFRDFYNIDRIEVLKGPNAMAFGRGGSGGVINRVSKMADGKRTNQVVASGGSFDNRRAQADLGDRVNDALSLRMNMMYEKSGTFRRYGDLERYGFNPTATFNLAKSTDLKIGYEYFQDSRFNDRGLPSHNGEVYKTKPSTFVGNPNENTSDAKVNSVFATITHDFSNKLQLKNYTRFTKTSKFYQNVYANGAVDSSGDFKLAAYNDATDRENFTNQTDVTKKFKVGSVSHTALLGAEITRQSSKNLRKKGYFNGSASKSVSTSNPINYDSVEYRVDTSVNNNSSDVDVYGIYAQDQIDITKRVQLIGGLRYDRFQIDLRNNHNNQSFQRIDNLISPRAGIVIKPSDSISFYGSYSVSYLPSSGDQFNSLDSSTKGLKPEELQNYEIGSKWDVNTKLNLTAALYQLDRTNIRSTDPNDSSRYVLSGESRTRGFELGAAGKVTEKWQIIGGYTYQEALVIGSYKTSSSTIKKGSQSQLAPRNRLSLWNKYDLTPSFAAALGAISQSSQFASADNAVKLKGFTRFDGAIYYKISPTYRLQLNAENLFGREYALTAHNNNNIQPGSPRAFKMSLMADF